MCAPASCVIGPPPQWYGPMCPASKFFKNIEKAKEFEGFARSVKVACANNTPWGTQGLATSTVWVVPSSSVKFPTPYHPTGGGGGVHETC